MAPHRKIVADWAKSRVRKGERRKRLKRYLKGLVMSCRSLHGAYK